MNGATAMMKLFLEVGPIALGLGFWTVFLAIEVVGRVLQNFLSETWIWVFRKV